MSAKSKTNEAGKAVTSPNNDDTNQNPLLLIDQIYCILASVFFIACAYANWNDPDPVWWISGYLTGGCFLNLLVLLLASPTLRTEAGAKRSVRRVIQVFAAVNLSVLLYWSRWVVLPHLVDSGDGTTSSVVQTFKDFGWSILEQEEGRNMGGLFLLFSHMLKLLSLTQPKSASTTKTSRNSSWKWTLLGTFLAMSLIGGATYLWIFYQPEMNKRQAMEHCNGAFDAMGGSSSSSMDGSISSRAEEVSEELSSSDSPAAGAGEEL